MKLFLPERARGRLSADRRLLLARLRASTCATARSSNDSRACLRRPARHLAVRLAAHRDRAVRAFGVRLGRARNRARSICCGRRLSLFALALAASLPRRRALQRRPVGARRGAADAQPGASRTRTQTDGSAASARAKPERLPVREAFRSARCRATDSSEQRPRRPISAAPRAPAGRAHVRLCSSKRHDGRGQRRERKILVARVEHQPERDAAAPAAWSRS